jgi:hypothetical protein
MRSSTLFGDFFLPLSLSFTNYLLSLRVFHSLVPIGNAVFIPIIFPENETLIDLTVFDYRRIIVYEE